MSPLERAASLRLAHVRGLARPLRPELASKFPVCKVRLGLPSAPDVSRLPPEASCKSKFSCRSGPRRGGTRRLPNLSRRAGGPGSGQKLEGGCKPASKPAVPTGSYVPKAHPLPTKRRCGWDTSLPTCSEKFPPAVSPRAAETQECPDSQAGGEGLRMGADCSWFSGRRGRPHLKKEVLGSRGRFKSLPTDLTAALGNTTPLYKLA